MKKYLQKFSGYAPLIISLLLVLTLFADFGFSQGHWSEVVIDVVNIVAVLLLLLAIAIRYLIFKPQKQSLTLWITDLLVLLFLLLVLFNFPFAGGLDHPLFLYLTFIIILFRELGTTRLPFSYRKVNPALLFVLSFLLIIFLGTMLLLLPHSTYQGISFTDALFTSTSAVCVTGLIVVDTGSYFTPLGQVIILLLIQVGGLGIMTFTSFFSYFFKGTSSFADHIMLKDITQSEKIGDVLKTLIRIIVVTLTVEAIGAILIYISISGTQREWSVNQVFFAIFHSVSAFCNAGFSTLSFSLYEPGWRDNYLLQFIIALIFIFGGLGFPIVFNVLRYFKYRIRLLFVGERQVYRTWVININSRIVFVTTFYLLLIGTVLIFFLEYDNTLAGMTIDEKLVGAFFSAATPRTAGFNSIDFSALHMSTIILVIALMWIGASPGSTGGGIKTTTFAIALSNIMSISRGKEKLELFRREVSQLSVRRAFATMILSLMVITLGIFMISIFEKDKTLMDIVFECFSAYSTVGLSLGITSALSMPSKLVIIIMMFVGRVGMLTIMIALMKKSYSYLYAYPMENILIN